MTLNVPREPRVPISEWGKDHWSTLGYLECRIVDNDGIVDRRHMRCHYGLHPQFAHSGGCASDHPTRLAGGLTADNHDDWSCVEDFIAEGLVVWKGTGIHPIFSLTDLGLSVCGKLRKHKAKGGSFGNFLTVRRELPAGRGGAA